MITLEKVSDSAVGSGAAVRRPVRNSGTGSVTFIANVPARRVRGALIRLTGTTFRAVSITPHVHVRGVVLVTLHRKDGTTRRGGYGESLDSVRGHWIRYAIANGVYAGVARMR